MAHEKFDVTGMTCASCQAHVDRAVRRIDGVSEVAVNLLSGSMAVDYDESRVTPDQITAAVDRASSRPLPPPRPELPQARPPAQSPPPRSSRLPPRR